VLLGMEILSLDDRMVISWVSCSGERVLILSSSLVLDLLVMVVVVRKARAEAC
jgi:hypothetical protein